MKTIYKYELPLKDAVEIEMPIGARVLTAHEQNGKPYIWALVDHTARLGTEHRRFWIVGTGNPAGHVADEVYVGSAFCGPFVWHVFTEER
jgi:hypothetical protein